MASNKILPKRFDLLDANDPDCKFRINVDVLNECFGVNRSMYMRAAYPDAKYESIQEINTGNCCFVWMPKLYGNSSGWVNTISQNGEIISEVAGEYLSHDWVETGKHVIDQYRIVFSKASNKDWYVFNGVYKTERMDHLIHSYKRIATKIRLIGNPVSKIEFVDFEE